MVLRPATSLPVPRTAGCLRTFDAAALRAGCSRHRRRHPCMARPLRCRPPARCTLCAAEMARLHGPAGQHPAEQITTTGMMCSCLDVREWHRATLCRRLQADRDAETPQPLCGHAPSAQQRARLHHRCRTAGSASPSALGAPRSASRTLPAAAPTARCRHPHRAAGTCPRCQHVVKMHMGLLQRDYAQRLDATNSNLVSPNPRSAAEICACRCSHGLCHGILLLGPTCISDAAVPEPTRPVPPSTST